MPSKARTGRRVAPPPAPPPATVTLALVEPHHTADVPDTPPLLDDFVDVPPLPAVGTEDADTGSQLPLPDGDDMILVADTIGSGVPASTRRKSCPKCFVSLCKS